MIDYFASLNIRQKAKHGIAQGGGSKSGTVTATAFFKALKRWNELTTRPVQVDYIISKTN